jgi:hypothetical protein
VGVSRSIASPRTPLTRSMGNTPNHKGWQWWGGETPVQLCAAEPNLKPGSANKNRCLVERGRTTSTPWISVKPDQRPHPNTRISSGGARNTYTRRQQVARTGGKRRWPGAVDFLCSAGLVPCAQDPQCLGPCPQPVARLKRWALASLPIHQWQDLREGSGAYRSCTCRRWACCRRASSLSATSNSPRSRSSAFPLYRRASQRAAAERARPMRRERLQPDLLLACGGKLLCSFPIQRR